MKIILQKLIASQANYSRRQAEQLIREGRVKLNGEIATLGQKADEADKLEIDNKKVQASSGDNIYIKLNKPIGYTVTTKSFVGEKNIFSLVNLNRRLFAAGRLDKNSSGLMILTDDGDFCLKLTHPRFEHQKTYQVEIAPHQLSPEHIIKTLKAGVDIGDNDGIVKAKEIKHLQNNRFEVILSEGKKRQIRRMFAIIGLEVIELQRTEMAGIKLGKLKEGSWEYLSEKEISGV